MANGSVVSSCTIEIAGLQASSLSGTSFTMNGTQGKLLFTSLKEGMLTDNVVLTFPSEYDLGLV